MTKRMLIDASHAEETRVVVLDGSRLDDYDVETSAKKQLKSNIYLAKVVRVEPSLQAAFVEYGGNRHGFLAFGEIHPDYYQIPVADRQRLLEMQEAEAREEEEEEEREVARFASPDEAASEPAPLPDEPGEEPPEEEEGSPTPIGDEPREQIPPTPYAAPVAEPLPMVPEQAVPAAFDAPYEPGLQAPDPAPVDRGDADYGETDYGETDHAGADHAGADHAEGEPGEGQGQAAPAPMYNGFDSGPAEGEIIPPETIGPETIGGEAEERPERRPPPRFMRNYKIQEVIRRRQILLVQVVKEERGTKGAALTTFISLAGRYSVLMPNSPRGGGISRKITSAADRKRLREVVTELEMPRGMGLIVRTAGANRPKPEIKRDCEYLLRLWDDVRERTLASTAPALIYEEANLIKRTIRDGYSRDIDEVVVDGEDAWRAAREFMRMLMPSHARKVQLWKDGGQPLFARNQVEAQLDSMMSPTVQLRSGGYLVINQAEALVAIDVNSGRSTRERGIEETALRTNLEAAEEVARQLRLRDLAGLIVIDFIDMEAKKHNAMVERRLKESLKNDRARIQVGHISHFGLLEMSRQRLRPSLTETSFVACPHCAGTGLVRNIESAALHVLRAIEEEGGKRRAAEIVVHVAGSVALYILNHKRDRLSEIEARNFMRVSFAADETLRPPEIRIEKIRAQTAETLPAIRPDARPALTTPEDQLLAADEIAVEEADFDDDVPEIDEPVPVTGGSIGGETASGDAAAEPGKDETAEEGEHRRRRRRRRRRGGRREDGQSADSGTNPQGADFGAGPQPDFAQSDVEVGAPAPGFVPDTDAPELIAEQAEATGIVPPDSAPAEPSPGSETDAAPARRRGQRGGRRRPRREETPEIETPAAAFTPAPYVGPTPADPFGGGNFDIFDVIEQAAQAPEHTAAPDFVSSLAPEPAMPPLASATPEPPPPPLEPTPEPVQVESTPAARPPAPPILAEAPIDIPPFPEGVEEPHSAPPVQPVVIADAPPEAEKRRGWWRRG